LFLRVERSVEGFIHDGATYTQPREVAAQAMRSESPDVRLQVNVFAREPAVVNQSRFDQLGQYSVSNRWFDRHFFQRRFDLYPRSSSLRQQQYRFAFAAKVLIYPVETGDLTIRQGRPD
jgi:hypothetical protein